MVSSAVTAMKWLRNALHQLMTDAVRVELSAQRATEQAHVVELVSSMHKVLDELNHTLSREAMRKSRAAAQSAKREEPVAAVESSAPATSADSDGQSPKARARARWQQLRQAQQGN